MDIKKRINARKIVLSCFYQHCFFFNLDKNPRIFDPEMTFPSIDPQQHEEQKSDFLDANFLKAVEQKKQKMLDRDKQLQALIAEYVQDYTIEELFPYVLEYFFDQWGADEVDADYVLRVWGVLPRYHKELIELVNRYAESFEYEKMDIVDQALLLLGYCEYRVMDTPKEVIINEMVELAKRYSDEGAPSLINGILDPLFRDAEKDKK